MGSREVIEGMRDNKYAYRVFTVLQQLVEDSALSLKKVQTTAQAMLRQISDFTEEELDLWNLIDIRAGSILERVDNFNDLMKGDSDE